MNQLVKSIVEIGPLIAFFGSYFATKNLIMATAIFMVVTIAALAYAKIVAGKFPLMLLISATIVLIFGGLTIALGDETFIKIKPTIVYLIFATILVAGLALGRLWIKHLFGGSIHVTDAAWRILTIRWAIFFVIMAGANEFVWRTYSTDVWMTFKFPFAIIFTFVFAIAQTPLILRHQIKEVDEEGAAD